MNSIFKKLLAFVLAAVMILAIAACKKPPVVTPEPTKAPVVEAPPDEPVATPSTLVVGYSFFSEKFSPFFSKTSYDTDVAEMASVLVMEVDREGNPVLKGIEGETRSYNGTPYSYKGISDIEVVQNDDGSVDYFVTLRDGVLFSDGTPMTIDDLLFTLYVLCDPTYDGSFSFYTTPIEGIEDYRSSMAPLWSLILDAGEDNEDFSQWTEAQQKQYWAAFWAAGALFTQEIADVCVNDYGLDAADYFDTAMVGAMEWWGFGSISDDDVFEAPSGATFDLANGEFPTAEDFFNEVVEEYGFDLSDGGINYESAGTAISTFIDDVLGADALAFSAGVNTGEAVPTITGIKKTGDNSLSIHCTEFDATAIYQFGIYLAPLHYYGDAALFDYDKDMFGFPKGDLSGVKAKTTVPLGAGPYKFLSYENGVVTFEANKNFWNGEPKIQYLLFQETADDDKLSGVVAGTFDVSDPNLSTSVISAIKDYNGNDSITGDVVTTMTVDFRGYGYIGLNANNIKVGDPGSDASKALRKGLATVLAVFRNTVVNSYYGERASVIQYPIANYSWAAPKPNDEGYAIAYSVDADGNPIYTDVMSESEREEAALAAAVGFFKAAGYTFDEASGMFTAAPVGAKLVYEIIIAGDGVGDHPSYGVLTAAKEALAKIGFTLEINDPADSNVLWNALEATPSTAELWCAAWQTTADPDMYQIYYSTNINGAGGTDSNHYYVTDPRLDELIIEARTNADQSFRKATYKQALDLIIDWAVELPVYQRQEATIFSTARIKLSTLTPDITTFWTWVKDIQLLELN